MKARILEYLKLKQEIEEFFDLDMDIHLVYLAEKIRGRKSQIIEKQGLFAVIYRSIPVTIMVSDKFEELK